MENNKCMVSVLCTAYNHGEYIAQALESFVTQQTDFAFEVLVNDDLSTDNTAEIIREYAEKYPNIIRAFIQEKNLYSQGINIYDHVFYPNVKGKYIALCEGDDYWSDPMKLQMQVDFLEANPEYSACVHNTQVTFCDHSAEDRPYVPVGVDRDIPFEQVIRGMSVSYHTSSILCHKDYLINSPDFKAVAVKYGFSDYPIGIWLSMKGKVHFIERTMSVYRVASNAGSWSHGVGRRYGSLKRFITGEIEMFKALLPHLDGAWLEAAKQELLEREFELFYIEGKVYEQIKPPYLEIYKKQDIKYRTKQFIKRRLPFLHNIYRKNKGYED